MYFKLDGAISLKIINSLSFTFLVFISIVACNFTENSENLASIKIDLKEEQTAVLLSEFVKDTIEVLSFENFDANGNPVYFKNIHRLAQVNGDYYVLDYIRGQFLMVFGQDGQFKRSIGFRGEGPGGYLQPMDFLISGNEIQVLDVDKVLVYNLNGEYLRQKAVNSFMANAFEKLSSGYAFIGAGMGSDNLILSNENMEMQSSFFPYHTRALNVLIVNPLFKNSNGKTIYRRYLNDTLFEIDGFVRPKPYLYIDFQQNKSNYAELLKSDNVEEAVNASQSEFCNVYAYYETDKYKFLVFSLKGERWNFIYSNITGRSKLFKQTTLIDDITFDPRMMPVAVIGDRFVLKANPENVLAGVRNQQGTSQIFQKLKVLEDTLDPEGNPMLFLVEFDF